VAKPVKSHIPAMARARTSKIFDEPPPQLRACEWPNCEHGGSFPAPKSRETLREYRWFCLDHVRQYNASWDYYAGMKADDIERHIRADTTWRRPSWPMGSRPRKHGAPNFWDEVVDPFDLFGGDDAAAKVANKRSNGSGPPLTLAQRKAMAVMEMEAPLTLAALRTRYKTLVKQYHPDRHGGDKRAEEKLKAINLAYSSLKQSLSSPIR
jgi:hypothetical protein